MEKKYMVLSWDTEDDNDMEWVSDAPKTYRVVNGIFDTLTAAQLCYEEKKENTSNVYLVEVLKEDEHI